MGWIGFGFGTREGRSGEERAQGERAPGAEER
jgi:hypothetical protein